MGLKSLRRTFKRLVASADRRTLPLPAPNLTEELSLICKRPGWLSSTAPYNDSFSRHISLKTMFSLSLLKEVVVDKIVVYIYSSRHIYYN